MQAWIQSRRKPTGVRQEVVYRLPGDRTQRNCGTFKGRAAKSLAKERLKFVQRELALGNDPRETLTALGRTPAAQVLLDDMYEAFITSRSNVDPATIKCYRKAWRFWRLALGNVAIAEITRDLLQGIVNEKGIPAEPGEKAEYAKKTLTKYLTDLKQPLDHAGITPNPARAGVNIPKGGDEEAEQKVPPTRAQFEKNLFHMRQMSEGQERAQAAEFMQALGLRCCEVFGLRVMDIDFVNGIIRVFRTKNRTGRRWLPVPPTQLEVLRGLCERVNWDEKTCVFRHLTDDALREGLRVGALKAKVPHCHPHLLRHDRLSLWVAMDINPQVAKAWAGHSKVEMTMDTYGHVVDWSADPYAEFWQEAALTWAVKKGKTTLREAA